MTTITLIVIANPKYSIFTGGKVFVKLSCNTISAIVKTKIEIKPLYANPSRNHFWGKTMETSNSPPIKNKLSKREKANM